MGVLPGRPIPLHLEETLILLTILFPNAVVATSGADCRALSATACAVLRMNSRICGRELVAVFAVCLL